MKKGGCPTGLSGPPGREGGSRTTAGWEPSALVGRSGAAADLWAWGLLGALPRLGIQIQSAPAGSWPGDFSATPSDLYMRTFGAFFES